MSNNPFEDFIKFVTDDHGEENWVTVYKYDPISNSDYDGGMYCTLVNTANTHKAMDQAGWDVMIGSGGPGFCSSYDAGEKSTTYYSNLDEGYLRIVLNRDFHGRKEGYIEILEEFRLFHNLFYENKSNSYLSFDDAGDEVDVVKVSNREVKIRRGFLRSFMAAKQMNLLLYYELTRHFKDSENYSYNEKSELQNFTIYSSDSYLDGFKSFSRILGKKLILCESIDKCGVWPFEREKEYQDFCIGGDSDEPLKSSCNPDKLANYFGANPGAPHYLTPVFFRNEVMQKYYGSSEYEIEDGHLRRTGSWGLRFDNNSSNHISVFLGDLGRDLPEKEQIYWKSFNLLPDGRKISKTNFERSFKGNFYNPEKPEHRFKYKYKEIQEYWKKKYGWQLFLPLSEKDEHFLTSLRSMLTNEQSEFDSQILSITKVTIDSVNVKSLRSHLKITDLDMKSISLLEELLKQLRSENLTALTSLLRGIQSVRSTGVAHRKGKEYEKSIAKMNIDAGDYCSEFDQILLRMIYLFDEVMTLDSGEPE
jgi:hypothetical protein